MIGEDFKKVLATRVMRVTLVGYLGGEFPRSRGNCFSVECENGQIYWILNFNHENLEKLLEDKVLEWPIMIHELEPGSGVIADPRIPDEWFDTKFCNSCTPRHLLPYPQKLKIEMEILRGKRTEKEVEIDGKKHIMTSIRVESQQGPVRVPWTLSTNIDNAEDNTSQ
jgi:hypothetical protein